MVEKLATIALAFFLCGFSKYFFFTLFWGKNVIIIEFTRRHIIKEIKVISYSYNNN